MDNALPTGHEWEAFHISLSRGQRATVEEARTRKGEGVVEALGQLAGCLSATSKDGGGEGDGVGSAGRGSGGGGEGRGGVDSAWERCQLLLGDYGVACSLLSPPPHAPAAGEGSTESKRSEERSVSDKTTPVVPLPPLVTLPTPLRLGVGGWARLRQFLTCHCAGWREEGQGSLLDAGSLIGFVRLKVEVGDI